MAEYPKTMQRGPLKGRTFASAQEYTAALNEWKEANPDAQLRKRSRKSERVSRLPVSEKMAAGVVSAANMVLAIIPATRDDLLDEIEQKALALAIVETAAANKFFANIILKVASVGSATRLVSTVGAIAAVRLARREVLPPATAIIAYQILTIAAEQPVEVVGTPLFKDQASQDEVEPQSEPVAAG